ncbi:putative short-chain dehydrogenase [Seiridium cupressi]
MAASKGTILVTGANGGLGSAIVRQIVSQPELAAYHGIYTVRDGKSASGSLRSILAATGSSHPHDIFSLDLAKLESMRQTAQTINERVASGDIPPIRALILNAGFQDFGKQAWNDDGLDMTFSANYLGHWLLTLLLLKSMDKDSGRVVIIGSQAHDPYDVRNERTKAFVDEKYKNIVQDEPRFEAIAKGTWSSAKEDQSYRSGFRRYGAAKLYLVMMIILGVDPGNMSTGLQRNAPWIMKLLIFHIVFPIVAMLMPNGPIRTTKTSASHVLQAAFDADPGPSGTLKNKYLDGTEPVKTSTESNDPQKRDLVWKQSVRYAHLAEGDTILADWQ